MYAIYVDGNMMKSRDTRKAVSHLEQSGKMYRKILNVLCVPQERILGLDEAESDSHAHVIHAGTAASVGRIFSAGGRVLTVVGTGKDNEAARETAYRAIERIGLAGSHYRRDIAANR
mgnify:CR=1 FL=1